MTRGRSAAEFNRRVEIPRPGSEIRMSKGNTQRGIAVHHVTVHSVVAPLEDLPEHGMVRGQVGTVVKSLAPSVYEGEFSDDEGRTYTSLAVASARLLVLHHEPIHPAP